MLLYLFKQDQEWRKGSISSMSHSISTMSYFNCVSHAPRTSAEELLICSIPGGSLLMIFSSLNQRQTENNNKWVS